MALEYLELVMLCAIYPLFENIRVYALEIEKHGDF